MLPALYSAFAGYKIEALRQEKHRLTVGKRQPGAGRKPRSLSPQHLEELAAKQSFVDPDPQKIVYLEGKHGEHGGQAHGAAPPRTLAR